MKQSEQFSEEETDKRMRSALERALNTPHKSNAKYVGKSAKPKATPRPKKESSK